jgi:hypothetical protein
LIGQNPFGFFSSPSLLVGSLFWVTSCGLIGQLP